MDGMRKLPPELDELAKGLRFLDRILDAEKQSAALAAGRTYLDQANEAWKKVEIAGDINKALTDAQDTLNQANDEAERIVVDAERKTEQANRAAEVRHQELERREQECRDAEHTNAQNKVDLEERSRALELQGKELNGAAASVAKQQKDVNGQLQLLRQEEAALQVKLEKFRELAG